MAQNAKKLQMTDPAAIVYLVAPKHEVLTDKMLGALIDFEHKTFPPGTAANESYQMLMVPWKNVCIFGVAVFPGEHLEALMKLLRPLGIALLRTAPTICFRKKHEALGVEKIVQAQLGLQVEQRVYSPTLCAKVGGGNPAPAATH